MKRLFLTNCVLVIILAGSSYADDDGVMVRVRALRALSRGTIEGVGATKALVASTSSKMLGSEVFVDKELSDLEPQLRRLPFSHFSLMESETEKIPLKTKSAMHLMSGDTLFVRPLGFENGKYCVWFKWMDKSGARIIDTRLHLEPGRSMLTGTDGSNESGTILAIDVMPAE